MRDYSTVSPQFWLGKTGRKLRKAGPEAQVVAFYLMTSPHANMLGLYYLPVIYLAHETGLGIQGASKGLKRTIEAGFCSYDEQTEMVWVHEMAAYQVGSTLKATDKRCAGVRNEYRSLPENPYLSAFFERYKLDFHLTDCREIIAEKQGASKGLSSQEQEQEQEQDQNTLVHGEKTASEPGPDFPAADFPDYPEADLTTGSEADSDAAGQATLKNRDTGYPAEFELAWREYPGRAGANPKKSAYGAWHARRREGVSPDVMLEGVRRYVNFLQATGKAGTEYVQRASTFFGPDRNFENAWSPPPAGGGERSIHKISPPETTIPDGFRGA